MKNNIQHIKIYFLLVLISLFQTSCDFKDENAVVFQREIVGVESAISDGTANSSSSLKEWQISDDKMECLVSNENRYLKLMTRQLGNQKGNVEMTVRVGFFNQAISDQNNNWAGFCISPKMNVLKNKNSSNTNNGIKIGVCTNGALFIGEPSPNHMNQAIIDALPKGLNLKIVVSPIENYYAINFSAIDVWSGEILANISKNYITQDKLVGQLELVSNFESKQSGKVNISKSVWFEDWVIKGSKVIWL